jgi:hypothetical protein
MYCDSCGAKLPVPAPPTSTPATEPQGTSTIEKIVFSFLALLVVLIIVFALAFSSHPSTETTTTVLPKPEPTEQEKLERGCKVVHLLYDDKPMSKLSLNDVKALNACRALGY